MRTPILVLLLVLPVAFTAGRWSAAEDDPADAQPKTVRAQRYRIMWADSAIDLSHGGGRWVDELFFPDLHLVATVVAETHYEGEQGLQPVMRPRVYVWRAEAPRTDLTGFRFSETDAMQPVVDVDVPEALAKAVAAFADLTDRYRHDGETLGADLASALQLKLTAGAEGN